MIGLEAKDRHGPLGVKVLDMLGFVQNQIGELDGQQRLDIDPGNGVGGKDDPFLFRRQIQRVSAGTIVNVDRKFRSKSREFLRPVPDKGTGNDDQNRPVQFS